MQSKKTASSMCQLYYGRDLELTLIFSDLVTHREVLMMRVMNTITDKPQWDQKVCLDWYICQLPCLFLTSYRSLMMISRQNGATRLPKVVKM